MYLNERTFHTWWTIFHGDDPLTEIRMLKKNGRKATSSGYFKDEQKAAKELFLLTSKPVLYVCNVDEKSAINGNKYVDQVREAITRLENVNTKIFGTVLNDYNARDDSSNYYGQYYYYYSTRHYENQN